MTNNTKKVVINVCFGGFSLSPKAVKRLAELQGKECYFFRHLYTGGGYEPITLEEATKDIFWMAFSVPNPNDYRLSERDEDGLYKSANERASKISIEKRDLERHDPLLIQVVEELGKESWGSHAKLKIVKIPADVEYTIEEYDGSEHIAEAHQTWS